MSVTKQLIDGTEKANKQIGSAVATQVVEVETNKR